MELKEAVYWLNNLIGNYSDYYDDALEMGIKALEQQENYAERLNDLISRQAAIDAYGDWYVEEGTAEGFIGTVKQLLEGLPSAQSEPHEGHWILRESYYGDEQYECSQCGVIWEFSDGTPKENDSYYCPHCGAKMKGVIHETD